MSTESKKISPILKLVLEMGPLVAFFVIYSKFGLHMAIGAFIPLTIAALVVYYFLQGKLPTMPLVSGVIVIFFGGLTLIFDNDTFFKMKPTIVSGIFGVVLLYGYYSGKQLLKIVFDNAFSLDDEGWRILTFRWAIFFIVLAVLNEVVWRTQTESFWVSFKVFGLTAISIVFAMAQTPLLMRHELKKDDDQSN
ncbi:septation protein A [Microvirga sp. W0021]|uniref:Inner membrane-spanning protein YciB n=1 Tax=Hohaiivirga grylli TaxID=3133970 RepID=A0ABV0BHE0_9HYPH